MEMLQSLSMEFEFPILLLIEKISQVHENMEDIFLGFFPLNSAGLVPQINKGEKGNLGRSMQVRSH